MGQERAHLCRLLKCGRAGVGDTQESFPCWGSRLPEGSCLGVGKQQEVRASVGGKRNSVRLSQKSMKKRTDLLTPPYLLPIGMEGLLKISGTAEVFNQLIVTNSALCLFSQSLIQECIY